MGVMWLLDTFVSQTMFEAFDCRDLGSESFMAVDYQVRPILNARLPQSLTHVPSTCLQTSCDGSEHVVLIWFGLLGVLGFSLAVPLGTLYILYLHRDKLLDRESHTFSRYSFLVAD